MSIRLEGLTLKKLHQMLVRRDITSAELVKHSISTIKDKEKSLCAFVTTSFDEAERQAGYVDELIRQNVEVSELAGIPMGLKDNICTKNIRTTCGSRMLENFVPTYEATVSKKLMENNLAVLMGKLNMDEFAMGSSTETSFFGITTNPWNKLKVAGGSSGGSAAAVASNQVFYALGSDTGGSIRQPAAFCGIVGLKPTYGLVSRSGVVAYASSLDQVGTLTRNVSDCAVVLNAIAGYDSKDSTSVNNVFEACSVENTYSLKGLKIGLPIEYFGDGIDLEVKESILKAAEKLSSLGAEIESVTLPHTDYALAAYYIISCAEASSNLARFDGVKFGYRTESFNDLNEMYVKTRTEGFGSEVKRRIMVGNYVLSSGYYDAYYSKATKVRTLIKNDFDNIFNRFDAILSPTTPTAAFNIGEKINDPLKMYMTDVYTVPVNIAGLPAISIPCGFNIEGLPIGMQLIGKQFSENVLLNIAYAYEQNTDHHKKFPKLECEGCQ